MNEPLPKTNPPKLRDAAVIGFGLTLALLLVGGMLGFINAGRLAYHNQRVAHTRSFADS